MCSNSQYELFTVVIVNTSYLLVIANASYLLVIANTNHLLVIARTSYSLVMVNTRTSYFLVIVNTTKRNLFPFSSDSVWRYGADCFRPIFHVFFFPSG